MIHPKKPNDLIVFARHFLHYAMLLRQVLVGLVSLIALLGVAFAFVEDLDVAESVYFAFITALTIGYGDVQPTTDGGRILSVVTGMVGLLFTGVTVAAATRALHDTSEHQKKYFDNLES